MITSATAMTRTSASIAHMSAAMKTSTTNASREMHHVTLAAMMTGIAPSLSSAPASRTY